MISKTWNESDVRNLFSRFGTIDDCTVLRLATGQSRGKFHFIFIFVHPAFTVVIMYQIQSIANCQLPYTFTINTSAKKCSSLSFCIIVILNYLYWWWQRASKMQQVLLCVFYVLHVCWLLFPHTLCESAHSHHVM